MTSQSRIERQLPVILADLATGSAPDYLDDVFAQTARIRQRPGWTFPERWLPVSTLTSRLVAAPPIRWRTIGVLVLLIVALVAAAIIAAGSRNQRLPAPFGPADNGPIIYAWQGDIYVRDTFGAEGRLLIGGSDQDQIAGFSRDGTKMAFFRRVRGLDELWVAGTDGSNPTRIGGPFNRTAAPSPWDVFDWSPLGDTIAVSSVSDGKAVIDLVRTDGGGVTRLDVGMEAADPAWRPGNSGQLAFRGFGSDPQAAIFLWQPDGSEPVRLALGHEVPLGDPGDFKNLAWAPGGDRLLYTTVDDGWYRLNVAMLASNGEVLDHHRVTASTTLEHEFGPVWLPTGDRLVYLRSPDGATQVRVMVGPTDGTPAVDLRLVGDEFVVSVSPDGEHVLAANYTKGEVSDVDLISGAISPGFPVDRSTTMAVNMQRVAP